VALAKEMAKQGRRSRTPSTAGSPESARGRRWVGFELEGRADPVGDEGVEVVQGRAICLARRAALLSGLTGSGMSPDRAEALVSAWETKATLLVHTVDNFNGLNRPQLA
jgi:hypothetical protein